ncbi:hypothetical protein BDK88_0111 [Natrinema hispanicum]|uniref:Uncharacterized protein n=1 Tax=Natrinema hispanicum TaxID=392421 RepID=A0A482YHA9_9EURY|nr:hypothetical protein [Natrinema hispanicum]RZV12570.1 hypothetical protein BDK88_0111 [Natrinema hispanicum]
MHKLNFAAVIVAALVCLSGCGAVTDFSLNDAEPESGPTETADTTRNTTSATATEVSQFLPFSSDLPVSGYLRTDEESRSGTGEGQVRVATRHFERTDRATAEGPSELTVTVQSFESRQAAKAAIEDRLEVYRANNSAISFSSTPVGVPVVQVVPSRTSGKSQIVSLSQYKDNVIVAESRSESSQYPVFSRNIVDVILLKIESEAS